MIDDAIRLIYQAEQALEKSDLTEAAIHYCSAGKILAAESFTATNLFEKDNLAYSAAVSYWNGGDYERSYGVCSIIRSNAIFVRELINSCKLRKESNYIEGARSIFYTKMADAVQNGQHFCASALEFLMNNPYIFTPITMTNFRIKLLRLFGWEEKADIFLEDLKYLTHKYGHNEVSQNTGNI